MDQPAKKISLVRGTGIVSLITLVSRVLGFVRDLLMARLFGASAMADAFFVAFRIPNLLRSFVAEGALTSAFVPVFSSELAKGHEQARAALRSITTLLLCFTAILSALGLLYAPQIVHFFAPGFGVGTAKALLCIRLTRIMFPFIICVSLVAMLNGALNSVNIFGAAAMAQVWMNVTLIVGAVLAAFFNKDSIADVLAWSVLAGGIAQVISQIPALRRSGFSLRPAARAFSQTTKEILILMAPALIGATVYQLQIFINTMLASLLSDGAVSWLFYADRVIQLPIGIFSIALASVLLPALSHSAANNDKTRFSKNLVDSLRYTSFVIIPVAIFLFLFAEPLIQLMFERRAFTHEATRMTALAVKAYAPGIWAVSCYSMLVRSLIAKKDTITPTLIGLVTLGVTSILSLAFMGPVLPSASSALQNFVASAQGWLPEFLKQLQLGHAGLALSSSCASFASLCLVALTVTRRENISWGPFLATTGNVLLASIVACIAVSFCGQVQSGLLALILGGFIYLAVWLGALRLLKSPELFECSELLKRKLKNWL